MPDKIDMSLDDIIKTNKAARRGGAGGRGGRGIGARFNNQRNGRGGGQQQNRRSLGAGGGGIQKRRSGSGGAQMRQPLRVPEGQWSHDMYSGVRRRSASATLVGNITTGPSKITISNLDFGVNDKDIQDLFEEFGAIKKAAVHYDRTGRSLGTADVVFEKKQDALKAIKKYNGVQLDGRAMNIQITEPVAVQQQQQAAVASRQSFSPRRGGALGGGGFRRGGSLGGGNGARRGFGGGARRGGRGGGARRGGNGGPNKTAAELDADLDSYASKMQTD